MTKHRRIAAAVGCIAAIGAAGAGAAVAADGATQIQVQAVPAQTQTQTQQTQTATQAKSDDPVALNNQGYSLLTQGHPGDAVGPLQRAVEAFRAQQRMGQIDYAYALYNLGSALRLAGHPGQAIPYVEERLRISSFKRGVVQKELKTARAQAA